jgi:threonine synthase
VGLAPPGGRTLAIASCGNAALAAAVVARAADRPLDVFVPTWVDEAILRRLRDLGARIEVVPRHDGDAGDPTYRRFRRAVEAGSLPFSCQGGDNGLAIEGGITLGYEIADDLRRRGERLERITIQVGGGALASAVIQGLEEAVTLGALETVPIVDTVQAAGAAPLHRAFGLVSARLGERRDGPAIEATIAAAARDRSAFMWPWEEEPRSIATGILDDETYDWLAVVRGMLSTGGVPIVVGEDELMEANDLAREATGIDVDATGSAGLAGLLAARRAGDAPATDHAAVLFTGARR